MPRGTSAIVQRGWEEAARAVPAGIKAPAVVAAVQRAILDAPLCAHVDRVTQLPVASASPLHAMRLQSIKL
jgi:hypothetical protein